MKKKDYLVKYIRKMQEVKNIVDKTMGNPALTQPEYKNVEISTLVEQDIRRANQEYAEDVMQDYE